VIEELMTVQYLVLDDYGSEKSTDWTAETIFTIIDDRIAQMRPTIVTSNLTLADIDRADPRLASRLGGMICVELKGADRRLL
jgi:DNA replication protein DnaC